MVYANYTPAKLPTVATELDRAVYAVKSLEALEIIGKLLYNAATSPKDERFRRIKLTNAKIQSTIVEVPGAVDLLLALGWVHEGAAAPQPAEGEAGSSSEAAAAAAPPEPALVIPAGKYMGMAEVRMIEDQKDRVRKEQRTAQAEVVRRAAQAAGSQQSS